MSMMHAIHFDSNIFPPIMVVQGSPIPTISATVKRTGAYSLRIPSDDYLDASFASLTLSSAASELYIQFSYYYLDGAYFTDNSRMFKWKAVNGTVLGTLRVDNATRKILVYTGDSVTLVATGSVTLVHATQYVIELHIIIGGSGIIDLRVNTIADATFSGNTQPGADTTIGILYWGAVRTTYSGSDYAMYTYIDDIIVNNSSGSFNNSWPNGAKVFYAALTGDGGTRQWSPLPAGLTHYTAIDDVPPSATDYIRATTTNLVDIFTVTDLPAEAGTVKAVIPQVYAFKGSVDPPTKLGIGIDVGGGVEYASDLDLSIMQSLLSNIWEQKPGGGNFTSADANALQLYLKSVT